MADLLRYLLIVSALTTPGLSLSCFTCLDLTGAYCTGSPVTCSAGYSCVTSLSVTTVGSTNQSLSLSRGCAAANQCNITGSLTFQYGKVKIVTSCCDTDSCNATIATLPADNATVNGLTCRTCASDTTDYCYTDATLQCNGAETLCGRMATYLSGTASVTNTIRGCATPSVCNILGNVNGAFGSLNTVVKTFCSSGCVGLQGTFYLSSLMMLILMKIIF
ncbi:phospholipase A2 inhibitor and Ly6/PLAUR domain-containing protein-like [Hyla sarda]|uniref:phospholipase A2 inhibitor and Ly6/PLAUR domain-containing protein-like n=1 Tax=Hyla sarda TaxID=327740 RepID=UPI0024C3F8F3|nr:phospholipase A2 inhibitor and Ly6/PLAUR domain-containing protein-like [Hyla sarda]